MFLRIDGWRVDRWRRNRLSALLGVEDRSAEIAGKWRTEHRTGVVAGQVVQSIGGIAVLGRIKFVAASAIVGRLKRVDQGAADPERSDQTEAGENAAREPRDARRGSPEAHRFGRIVGRRVERHFRFAGVVDVAHDPGLPSVRTILTVCWRSPLPSRNSAAAKMRSTIRMFR